MSKKFTVIVIGVLFLTMGLMGGGFFLLWHKMSMTLAQVQTQGGEKKEAQNNKAAKDSGMGPIYKMETMIVNLADQGGKRYLRITMEMELTSPQMVNDIELRLPQLRDAILMILPSRQYADIATTEGKTKLRDELITSMNALLRKNAVKTIYFTEFVVQ